MWFELFLCRDLARTGSVSNPVRDLSAETDDIPVKASVDPSWACRGMGKGHMHVDFFFFTTCPRVKAHKRTRRWRRRKTICGSHYRGPWWPLCSTAAQISFSPDVECGTWPLITDVARGRRGEGRCSPASDHKLSTRRWLWGSNSIFTVRWKCTRKFGVEVQAVCS